MPVRVSLIVKTGLIIKSLWTIRFQRLFPRRRFSVLGLGTEAQSQGTEGNARMLLVVPSPLVSEFSCVCSSNRSLKCCHGASPELHRDFGVCWMPRLTALMTCIHGTIHLSHRPCVVGRMYHQAFQSHMLVPVQIVHMLLLLLVKVCCVPPGSRAASSTLQ